MLSSLLYISLWYLLGTMAMLGHYLILNFIKKEEIIVTYNDVVCFFGYSMAGPLLFLIPVFKKAFEIMENYDTVKDKVVWRNRRAKTKQVLYGDPDDE